MTKIGSLWTMSVIPGRNFFLHSNIRKTSLFELFFCAIFVLLVFVLQFFKQISKGLYHITRKYICNKTQQTDYLTKFRSISFRKICRIWDTDRNVHTNCLKMYISVLLPKASRTCTLPFQNKFKNWR